MIEKKLRVLIIVSAVISVIFSSCSVSAQNRETTQKLTSSETVFELTLPESLHENEEVYFELIDEITGISLNPTRYRMEKKDDFSVFIRLPLVNGSLIKYRFVLHTDIDTIEKSIYGDTIHYRTFYVSRPAIVKNTVISWKNGESSDSSGEISGYVYDNKTDLPISDVFISINGSTTLTGSDGFYQLKNLPVGEYLITAYHPDGVYSPFQQGAVISENALTPASFGLEKAKLVNVTFEIQVPENTVEGAPVRLMGNTYSTGNIFDGIFGGTTIIASRAPVMQYDGDGRYHLTLALPSGIDFRYKYSLGDGFINAEHAQDGKFVSRQYIVPKKDAEVTNFIHSWSREDGYTPITFLISTPANTPTSDFVSIQFNPFSWLQPIPTWKTGENKWMFTLYSPFDYIDNSQFRFCRNNMCGIADDQMTAGKDAIGFILNAGDLSDSNTVSYTIENWHALAENKYQIEPFKDLIPKENYLKSISFSTNYDINWILNQERAVIDTAISGANTLFISPSWQFDNTSTNQVHNKFSDGYQTQEIDDLFAYTQDAGISLNFYPQPEFSGGDRNLYWQNAPLTYNWWLNWFEAYSQLIKNYAYLANIKQSNYFVFGGASISPALPGGRLPNGSPSNTPYDISERWAGLVSEIRSIYNGTLIFALEDKRVSNIENYAFLTDVDAILVEMNTSLASNNNPPITDMKDRAAQFLDTEAFKIPEIFAKPVILSLNYTSVDGASSGCINYDIDCSELVNDPDKYDLDIDINEQADIYSAVLSAAVTRDWIVGVNSAGFEPSVTLQDESASIHGKPAFDVLTYYFSQVTK